MSASPSRRITRATLKRRKKTTEPEDRSQQPAPMGNRCFKDESSDMGHDSMDIDTDLPAHPASNRKGDAMSSPSISSTNWSTLPALEHAVKERSGAVPPRQQLDIETLEQYENDRKNITKIEQVLAFDFACFTKAGQKERDANAILQLLRQKDKELFERAPPRKGYQNQPHKRHPSDHHLTNLDLVKKTDIFRVARKMPKGAHLHVHFNSCLEATFLLNLAKDQEKMDIGSNTALMNTGDLEECEIQFTIRGELGGRSGGPRKGLKRAWTRKFIGNPPKPPVLVNLFDKERFDQSEEPADKIRWMSYKDFRDEFPHKFPGRDLDAWLEGKLVYNAEEAHGVHQTAEGAWAKFNGRTRMMKGLFNYETAYRKYTQQCLQDFVDDNIQYAEIRPNFMHTNQVWSTDGKQLYDNYEIMKIIADECNSFLENWGRRSDAPFFQGIKVIYCTPRSFPDNLIKDSLVECLGLKLSEKTGHMIAGFDLVGQESAGRPLRDHVQNLLEFQASCKKERVEIPFLFHCGETLEMGTDTDGNVVDALLLGSKRIGHGFSLSRHPYIMEKMKEQNICLEVCPISNEILGLTPRIGGHAMYNLLANNVHCTVNSDNGTLFRSSLSHDFYQVFVGRDDFTLHGWRQLIEWSLEHACLDEIEHTKVYNEWNKLWDEFLDWILETYEVLLDKTNTTRTG
ncbi:hypothetical protein GGTG_00147 [Gaeumannomyces tritici R3-111a-1]|uniref:Adenosine deaminase domain-containing protein n=1 Tax=Gaeumannomyces tritici (strain R3-111a-1) TaxID=644352 RepID=J3NFV3_GAET3|nr:hypothetical protein GGTG_00147 [Gaeumannomyces tritici R3-111a-1]EJT80143.1 hypothetical protein GGTG_00147 [Gaeumannomyces tritici R3-111a-1]